MDSSEGHVGSLFVIVSGAASTPCQMPESATRRPWFSFTQHCGSPHSEQGHPVEDFGEWQRAEGTTCPAAASVL